MSTQELSFSAQDITTVYDALQGCSAESLAGAMLGHPAVRGKTRLATLGVASRRIASMLRVLSLLGPNCEASSHIVLPWKASHLSQLSCMSWQDALGTRIALPAGLPDAVRSRLLARALLCISYV